MFHVDAAGRPRAALHRPSRATLALIAGLLTSLLPAAAVTVAAVGVNLGFTTPPPNPATAAVAFPVTVHVQDNAAAALSGVQVTLDIDPAHNPGGATLNCTSGTSVTSNASGNAAFTGCRINQAANGYQLRAGASGATAVTSPTFDVHVGPAAALSFSGYPSDPTLPDLNPQPAVRVVDAAGNVVTTDNRTITLSINKRTSTFTCTGGLSKAAVGGVAQFTGCRQGRLDTGYRLTANDGPDGLPAITGAAFRVATGTPAALQFCWGTALPCITTPPTTISGGKAFPVQPVVRIVDAAGNTIATDDNTRVTLSLAPGTPLSGGPGTLACTGGLTERANNGVTQFAGCSIDKAGTSYRLNASSSPTLPAVQSNPFNVGVGAPVKLAFTMQPPASATAGTPFGSAIQVAIEDSGGVVVTTGIVATLRLSLANNPGGGSLTCLGGLDATTDNGVATLTGCQVSSPGTGYRLSARTIATTPTTTLAAATSDRFNVLPAGAILGLTTNPPSGVITWGGTVMLTAHFTFSGAGRMVALQVSRELRVWDTIATLRTDGSGNATFPYRPSDNRWYRAVFAGAPDLGAAISPIARVVVRQVNLLRPKNLGLTRHVPDGTTIHFASTVRPNRPDLPTAHVNFVVYRLIGGTWVRVLSRIDPVDAAGVARLDLTFSTRGSYYVRSQAVPTPLNANSAWSPPERYDVS